MKRIGMAFLLSAAVLSAVAVEEMRPSAFEMQAWNATVPPKTRHNAVFSPVGFSLSVAMLGEGISGVGRKEMAEALGLITDFSVAFANVIRSYADANVSNRVAISSASSLWTVKRRSLNADYIHMLHRDFDAEAGFLNGISPVNAWTEVKTDGRISDVLPEMPKNVDTLLVNAMAFEGAWEKPFYNERGKTSDFTREDGSKIKTKMLRTECPFLRVKRPRYEAAKVAFASKGVSFIAVLPAAGVDLAELREKDFAGDGMDELKILFRKRSGDDISYTRAKFHLPAFMIRSDWDLEPTFRAAKVPTEGYNRMGKDDFSIDKAIHSAYIKITGRGYSLTPGMELEAEDVRGGKERGGRSAEAEEEDAPPGKPFICDRPFLFFVWDVTTDTVILAGQYTGIDK